ncbi:MAG: hypothetical protein ACLS8R_02000 [Anaeromassilibacillus sp.]
MPDQADWLSTIRNQEARMASLLRARVEQLRQQVDSLAGSRVLRNPQELLAVQRMRIDGLSTRLSDGIKRRLTEDEARAGCTQWSAARAESAASAFRGYAIASAAGGEVVSSVEQAQKGDKLSLRLLDGQIACLVERTERFSEQEESGDGKKGDDV